MELRFKERTDALRFAGIVDHVEGSREVINFLTGLIIPHFFPIRSIRRQVIFTPEGAVVVRVSNRLKRHHEDLITISLE